MMHYKVIKQHLKLLLFLLYISSCLAKHVTCLLNISRRCCGTQKVESVIKLYYEVGLKKLNDIDMFHHKAYGNSTLYKKDGTISCPKDQKEIQFTIGNMIILLDSKLHLFLGKQNSRWIGQYQVVKVFPYGDIELENNVVCDVILGEV